MSGWGPTQVAVLGGGPGGYAAAFRAADLGFEVTLVEHNAVLGGVCLNVGCIPSKALLHAAKLIEDSRAAHEIGLNFGELPIDIGRLRDWQQSVVGRLTGGLDALARARGINVMRGVGRLESPNGLVVEVADGAGVIKFEHCVLAVGSRPSTLAILPADSPRVWDSTDALALSHVPGRLLVAGGGIIGVEMATVFAALGSRVTIVEATDGLMPGCDRDLVAPLERRLRECCEAIHLDTFIVGAERRDVGIDVLSGGSAGWEGPQCFDEILVARGRRANGDAFNAERAGLTVRGDGSIEVDAQRRTSVAGIYAVGDLTGAPMLAHKATHEGKVAAEVIAGSPASFEPRAIPSVVYTDPEIAWAGLTETEAVANGIPYERAAFPWAASGRALTLNRPEGLTKLLVEPGSRRVLGGGIVGPGASELIGEVALAVELGADCEDLALTVHPHPTLSETTAFAAEVANGTVVDLPPAQHR